VCPMRPLVWSDAAPWANHYRFDVAESEVASEGAVGLCRTYVRTDEVGGASLADWGWIVGAGGLVGEETQVQLSFVGKYGIEFSGKRSSSALLFRMKVGQVGEALGCDEPSPHDTHFGAALQLFDPWASLAQLEHFPTPRQASCVWPYSWHLTHLIGIRRSLRTLTKWSSTRIRLVRSLLAVSRLRQATFRVAVVWLGDLFSGRLHHDAETIEPSSRPFSCSMLRR
jgi:hypothetical protein